MSLGLCATPALAPGLTSDSTKGKPSHCPVASFVVTSCALLFTSETIFSAKLSPKGLLQIPSKLSPQTIRLACFVVTSWPLLSSATTFSPQHSPEGLPFSNSAKGRPSRCPVDHSKWYTVCFQLSSGFYPWKASCGLALTQTPYPSIHNHDLILWSNGDDGWTICVYGHRCQDCLRSEQFFRKLVFTRVKTWKKL